MFVIIITIVIVTPVLLLLLPWDSPQITNCLLTSKSLFWEIQPELSSDVKMDMCPCYPDHNGLNQELVLMIYGSDLLIFMTYFW